MRILYISHGYPPREGAGTEQHCRLLVEAMRARGHHVGVIAATRDPGRRHGEVYVEAPGLWRITSNFPARPLSGRERDPAIAARIRRIAESFQPDVVHVHHLQFLCSTLRFAAPTVFTLHDGWTWCAAGGTELLPDGRVCPGPEPERCAPCAASWRPMPTRTAGALVAIAGRLSPWVDSDRLHGLWKLLPDGLRRRIAVRKAPAPADPPEAAAARNKAMLEFAEGTAAIVSPSAYLAGRAEAQGLPCPVVIPHGINERFPRIGGGGFLFLGTMAPHKGPDLVSAAHRRAFGSGGPPLRLHGSSGGCRPPHHRAEPPLAREEVWRALQRADALVMGSKWAENAPMVILEARACGCPVIAPALGGIPELVEDGTDGFLYGPGDEESLAEAMLRVARGPALPVRPPPALDGQLDHLEQLYGSL